MNQSQKIFHPSQAPNSLLDRVEYLECTDFAAKSIGYYNIIELIGGEYSVISGNHG
jgi:hypothetical protein